MTITGRSVILDFQFSIALILDILTFDTLLYGLLFLERWRKLKCCSKQYTLVLYANIRKI